MQHTFTLAAWNFRLARRSLLALWGFFAAQQAAVILWRAAQPGAAGLGLASHYYATMQIFAYLGFYLLTALEAGLATHNSRRARSGYTWATLPGTPGQKFAAKAITIAAAELVFAAWQLVWYIVEFYPVTALEGWRRRQLYGAVLPAAKSGVLSAVILGIGRAIGETMAVVMVAGNQTWMPKGLFQGLRTMTSNIVIEMGYAADLHREALIATGVVLFVFILLINLCFSLVKGGKDYA